MSEHLTQDDYPSSWTRDCPSKGTKVEISVYDTNAGSLTDPENIELDWIEIPTAEVEMWERRGNGPHIKKNAKIKFPTEWDGADVREVVQGFGIEAVTFGRVWLKDQQYPEETSVDGDDSADADSSQDNWVLDHCGIIAGVGGTNNTLESKAWIYDMTYAFDGIGVTQSYTNPTVDNVLQDVISRLNDTYIPLVDVAVLPPNGEAVYLKDVASLPDASERSGSSYYGYDTSEDDTQLGDADIREITVDTGIDIPLPELLTTSADDIIYQELFGTEPPVEKLLNFAAQAIYNNTPLGTKQFTRNHDNIGDVLSWLAEKTGIQWHFEPVQNGTVLVITSGPMRRTFVQSEVREDVVSGDTNPPVADERGYLAHELVDVRLNQALFEIAPANTIVVKGDTKESLLEGEVSLEGVWETFYGGFTPDAFPVAKARAVPLVEAAGGNELVLESESDSWSLQSVKAEAITRLQDHLNQSSEGNIVLDGTPRMLPYDVLDAYETCDDYVTEQVPVRYEIEQIKHTDSMTSTLETELNVQAFVGEDQIEFDDELTGMRGTTVEEFAEEGTVQFAGSDVDL